MHLPWLPQVLIQHNSGSRGISRDWCCETKGPADPTCRRASCNQISGIYGAACQHSISQTFSEAQRHGQGEGFCSCASFSGCNWGESCWCSALADSLWQARLAVDSAVQPVHAIQLNAATAFHSGVHAWFRVRAHAHRQGLRSIRPAAPGMRCSRG